MSNSQLSVEYNCMEDRRELYAKFGIAAEAAQLFETELGTLLLCLKALDNNWHSVPDGAAARTLLDDIDRKTLGQLLQSLKRQIKFDDGLEDILLSALRARNRLTHGFFETHNFKIQSVSGRRDMIMDMDYLHGEMFKAWQVVGEMTSEISRIIYRGAQARTDIDN